MALAMVLVRAALQLVQVHVQELVQVVQLLAQVHALVAVNIPVAIQTVNF